MGCQVFGRREGVPYYVVPAAGIEDQVFCMIDGTATGARGVKVAAANTTVAGGLVGVVQTGVWHGHVGSGTDKYPQNADINVVTNGQVRVKILQTTTTDPAYLGDGDLVVVGTGGKAAKYTAPSGTIADPTMTADIGTTDVGAVITAATAKFGDAYAKAEANAAVEEILEDTLTAEAILIKAYVKEWVAEYVTAALAGVSGIGVVGRCIGDPVGGVVCVELIGLGGIQQG